MTTYGSQLPEWPPAQSLNDWPKPLNNYDGWDTPKQPFCSPLHPCSVCSFLLQSSAVLEKYNGWCELMIIRRELMLLQWRTKHLEVHQSQPNKKVFWPELRSHGFPANFVLRFSAGIHVKKCTSATTNKNVEGQESNRQSRTRLTIHCPNCLILFTYCSPSLSTSSSIHTSIIH